MGSGVSINILGQPWLLDDNNPFITSNSMSLNIAKVASITSINHSGWDEDILADLFNERDQHCIRSIQIGQEGIKMFHIGLKEHKGITQ